MTGSGSFLSCSSCGKSQKQVTKLIAGVAQPRAFICDGCADRARAALAEPGQCGFCGQRHDQATVLESAGGLRICADCLARCAALLSEA